MSNRVISILFAAAAAYDGILGAAFLCAPAAVFRAYGVTPPNHFAYVQFPAALLLVFALMFVAVARRPLANANLIPYGALLKLSYCGLAFWYWAAEGIPGMWKPFAIIDAVTLVLFVAAWRWLRAHARPAAVRATSQA